MPPITPWLKVVEQQLGKENSDCPEHYYLICDILKEIDNQYSILYNNELSIRIIDYLSEIEKSIASFNQFVPLESCTILNYYFLTHFKPIITMGVDVNLYPQLILTVEDRDVKHMMLKIYGKKTSFYLKQLIAIQDKFSFYKEYFKQFEKK